MKKRVVESSKDMGRFRPRWDLISTLRLRCEFMTIVRKVCADEARKQWVKKRKNCEYHTATARNFKNMGKINRIGPYKYIPVDAQDAFFRTRCHFI